MSVAYDINAFVKGLDQLRGKLRAAAVRGVDLAGEQIIGDSQQLTPVDTGFLQASATSTPATIEGNLVVKTVGHNAKYAAPVHENLTAHHDVGQAKFLETAIRENVERGTVGKAVASSIAKVK